MSAAVQPPQHIDSPSKTVEAQEKPEKNSFFSFALSIVKEVLEFKGWDPVFKVLLYGFILWALYNLKMVYIFQTSPGDKYSFYDFKIALIALAGFVAYKYLCCFLFYGMLSKRLDLSKCVTEDEKQKKIELACQWLGSMIYYTTSSLSAYFLFRDQYFFPTALGGTGEYKGMFHDFPNVHKIPFAVEFYMIQFASHVFNLIDYGLYKLKGAKAWDMFLHHCMAVFLIFFSFLLNNVPVGIMVLYVHDPADIFVYLNRFVSSFKGTSMAVKGTCYLGFVTTWLYFRLYAFPTMIITKTFEFLYSVDELMFSPILFLVVMLSFLVVLHWYWFMFIIRILLVMLKGKSDYNVYDKSKQKKAE